MSEKKFPLFLKLSAMNTWYKILNDHTFLEVKSLGSYYSISEFSDDILPMRNHIQDLIEGDGIELISNEDFQTHLDKLSSDKELRRF